jgi:hypothetical protein
MTWIQTTQQFLSTFNSANKTFACATDGGLKTVKVHLDGLPLAEKYIF